MLARLIFLFILIPVIELILLVEIGQRIGTVPTIGLIIFTGILGAFLTRRQGLQVLSLIRSELQAGRLPTDSIFDGAVILVAGAFLMTPGILTDTIGFLCLIPATRRLIKRAIWTRIGRAMDSGRIFVVNPGGGPDQPPPPEDVVTLDPDDYSTS